MRPPHIRLIFMELIQSFRASQRQGRNALPPTRVMDWLKQSVFVQCLQQNVCTPKNVPRLPMMKQLRIGQLFTNAGSKRSYKLRECERIREST